LDFFHDARLQKLDVPAFNRNLPLLTTRAPLARIAPAKPRAADFAGALDPGVGFQFGLDHGFWFSAVRGHGAGCLSLFCAIRLYSTT
jgi:hypothetical protein